jgi:hypothetical protein
MKMTLRPLPLAFAVASFGLVAAPAEAHHRYAPPPPPDGRVLVTNQSGGDVDVNIDGRPSVRLPAWQSVTLWAPAGTDTLRATYSQLGAARTLEVDRVYADPRRTAYVVLQPETRTRVLVTNATHDVADLLVNGQPSGRMSPGATTIIGVPVGRSTLSLAVAGGIVTTTTLDARAFLDNRWTAIDPRVDLVLTNPLPIPVEVTCGSQVHALQPRGRDVCADMAPGLVHLTARRTTHELIGEATMELRPGAQAQWSVNVPNTGLVAVDSDHWLATRLLVDGRASEGLAPFADTRLLLPVGWHRVQARDERGAMVEDTWVDVEPFDVARVTFGTEHHVLADDRNEDCHHDDRHDRDEERWEHDHDRDDDEDRRDRDEDGHHHHEG